MPGRLSTSSVGAVAVAVEGVIAAVASDGADTIVELGAGCGACNLAEDGAEDGAEDIAEPAVTGSK